MDEPRESSPEGPAPGFETSDVRIGRAELWAGGLFLVVVLITILVGGLLLFLQATTERRAVTAVEEAPMPPPEPRLQTSPTGDLARLRAVEQRRLDGLGWVDRPAGIAHIPIDRAERLMAERGWPTQKPQKQE
jgi:hypothetical protein